MENNIYEKNDPVLPHYVLTTLTPRTSLKAMPSLQMNTVAMRLMWRDNIQHSTRKPCSKASSHSLQVLFNTMIAGVEPYEKACVWFRLCKSTMNLMMGVKTAKQDARLHRQQIAKRLDDKPIEYFKISLVAWFSFI